MPTGFMRSCQQKRGMYTPCSCAALMSSSPFFASKVFPSTVTVTVSFSTSGFGSVVVTRSLLHSRSGCLPRVGQ